MQNRTRYRVIYGDTDQMGVVYYANYLAFFERGRCEFLNAAGFDYGALEKSGYFFAVVDAHVRYRQPARYNDEIIIETTLSEATRIRLVFTYRVLRHEKTDGKETLLALGETTLACLDKNGRPARMPDDVAARLTP